MPGRVPNDRRGGYAVEGPGGGGRSYKCRFFKISKSYPRIVASILYASGSAYIVSSQLQFCTHRDCPLCPRPILHSSPRYTPRFFLPSRPLQGSIFTSPRCQEDRNPSDVRSTGWRRCALRPSLSRTRGSRDGCSSVLHELCASGGRGQASALRARCGAWWSSGSGYGDPRPFCHHVWWAARSQRQRPAQALCPRPLGPAGQDGEDDPLSASSSYPRNSVQLISTVLQRWNACRIHVAPAEYCTLHRDPAAPWPVGVDDLQELRRPNPGPGVRGLLSIASHYGLADIDVVVGLRPMAFLLD